MKFLKCVFVIFEKHFGSILISIAIIAAAMIYAYYNPYQSCKRDGTYWGEKASIICSGSTTLSPH